MVSFFYVASPSGYLVITGIGATNIKLVKKAWVMPGHKCRVLDISPVNYTFDVQDMSVEKLPFVLPAVFTIGPQIDDHESLLRYARLISPGSKNYNRPIIQDESRHTRPMAN